MTSSKRSSTIPPGDILTRQREMLGRLELELIQKRPERERAFMKYAQSRGYSERKTDALLAKAQRNSKASVEKQRALLLQIEQGDCEAIDEARSAFDAMKTMEAGIAESDRREHGDFDGMLGNFSKESSGLLRHIVSYLRDYLLDRYSDQDARTLLKTYEPRAVYRNLPVVDHDIQLAIALLNMIVRASRCDRDRFAELIFGKAGARDQKLRASAREPRRSHMPGLDDWLLHQDLQLTNEKLFNLLPKPGDDSNLYVEDGTVTEVDRSGHDHVIRRSGFNKRVATARKRRAASN